MDSGLAHQEFDEGKRIPDQLIKNLMKAKRFRIGSSRISGSHTDFGYDPKSTTSSGHVFHQADVPTLLPWRVSVYKRQTEKIIDHE